MLREAREEVVATARRMAADGLVVGTSGNVSARVGELVAVTPTGVGYDAMTAEDVPVVDAADGRVVDGALKPTSELPMHLAAYREFGAGAVVHTHAVHATAVSTLVDEVPPIHYQTAALGGVVRVAPYATYGTDALAEGMVEAMRDRHGCLLRNHGTVVTGASVAEAFERTTQLEWMCRVWLAARAVGTPSLISDEELGLVAERFKGYGQR
ncbi:fuculose phosphate aldolase [Mangrovactinospora gilvigrisea]|uniref:Fuculose phosphate aldolase n=2 Tax=Mangrovactinospora gilvigrisea TaxID=1428644 RepID=A0A1J7C3P9_9ACTN|nr:fuculose phosphate aldolase [Mangrovactinospora gilvigrisea]